MTMSSRGADRYPARDAGMQSSPSGSAGDMTAQVQDAAAEAKQKAGEIASQAKQTTTDRANEQKARAVDSLGSVARAFGDVGDQIRDQNPTLARYADVAADKINQFADQVGNRDVTDLLADAEDYARRNPAIFLGGAFALGMLGARFLKSSRPSQAGSSSGDAMRYRGPGAYHTADARYTRYAGRAATPPRTSYRAAGYQQPASPSYYAPDERSPRPRETGRDAFGGADPSMTTDTARPGSGEDRYGTR